MPQTRRDPQNILTAVRHRQDPVRYPPVRYPCTELPPASQLCPDPVQAPQPRLTTVTALSPTGPPQDTARSPHVPTPSRSHAPAAGQGSVPPSSAFTITLPGAVQAAASPLVRSAFARRPVARCHLRSRTPRYINHLGARAAGRLALRPLQQQHRAPGKLLLSSCSCFPPPPPLQIPSSRSCSEPSLPRSSAWLAARGRDVPSLSTFMVFCR